MKIGLKLLFVSLLSFFLVKNVTAVPPVKNGDASKKPIVIGTSMGMTGSYEKVGTLYFRAYSLWERDINKRGGILGRPVKFIIRDDKSNPEIAKKIYEDFIVKDKVDFVLGPYSGIITLAILPISEQHGYPVISAGASSDDIWKKGYKNIFAMSAAASRYPIGFLNLLSEKKLLKIAIVRSNDVFSKGLTEGTEKWSVQYGIKIVSEQSIAKGMVDLTKQAQIARDSGADALILAGHYEESVNMRKALKQIGWLPKAYWAAVGPGLDAWLTAMGEDAEGAFTFSYWEIRDDIKMPGALEFIESYKALYKEKPSYFAARAYASAEILAQAIKRAGSTDPQAVSDILYKLNLQTFIGRYQVDRTGVQPKNFPMVVQWQKGKREIVWPEELRTANPIFSK